MGFLSKFHNLKTYKVYLKIKKYNGGIENLCGTNLL